MATGSDLGGALAGGNDGSIYVVRFQGELAAQDVSQLIADGANLTAPIHGTGSAPATGAIARVSVHTRNLGTSQNPTNEVQALDIVSTSGTFLLDFAGEITAAITISASNTWDNIVSALDALSSIAAVRSDGILTGNNLIVEEVTLDQLYSLRFADNLAATDVAAFIVRGDALALASVIREGGTEAATNSRQIVTVGGTSGTFKLSLAFTTSEGDAGAVTTDTIRTGATAFEVENALQRAVLGSRFASDVTVQKTAGVDGDVYIVNFDGVLRLDGGGGATIGLLEATEETTGVVVGIQSRMDGINYYGVDTLTINTGSGAETVSVQGTTANTTLNLAVGNHQVFIASDADLDAILRAQDLDSDNAPDFDFLSGDLDRVIGDLTVNAGSGRHRLMISDEAATTGDGSVEITDLGTNDIEITGLAPAKIAYSAGSSSDFGDGISYWAGSGDDTITIDGTHKRAGVWTITQLNTGAGNDTVTVSLDAATDGFFALNTQDGADEVKAGASDLPLVIFGGLGNDTIIGGTADNIVFGDQGRVHYGSGANLVRLGGGGPGDRVNPAAQPISTIFNLEFDPVDAFHPSVGGNDGMDADLGGNDQVTTGVGDDTVFGGQLDDVIDAGDGNNIVIGDNGSILYDTHNNATYIDVTTTTGPTVGGSDTIDTGDDDDIVLGGTAGDTIGAGEGNNIVIGDHGFIVFGRASDNLALASETLEVAVDRSSDPEVYSHPYTRDNDPSDIDWIESTAWHIGGPDEITTGAGTDIVIGGTDSDLIAADAGDNLVLGDSGQIAAAQSKDSRFGGGATFAQAVITLGRVMSTAPVIGGNDEITTLGGNDIVLAGMSGNAPLSTVWDPLSVFRDVVDAGGGNNIVLGDSGLLVFAQAMDDANPQRTVTVAVDPTQEWDQNDPATSEYSYTYTSDENPGDIDWIESTAWSIGGADEISTGAGTDIAVGGAGSDLIAAGAGDNLVLGDSGQIVAAQSDDSRFGGGAEFGPAVITLGRVLSTAPVIGGNDRITTLGGDDIVLAGMSGDTPVSTLWDTSLVFRDVVDAGDGNNTVLGDSGLIVFAQEMDDDGSQLVVSVTVSVDPTQDVYQGDPATSEYNYPYKSDSNPNYNVSSAEDDIDYITTTAPTIGGPDSITTGTGNDIILGGTAGDAIIAGAGNDLVFGDHGELRSVTPDSFPPALVDPGIDADLLPLATYYPQFTFTAIDTENFDDDDVNQVARVGGDDWISSGVDILSSGSDQDIVLGQQGSDVIYGGADDDDLIGGHNVATVLMDDQSIEEAAHDEGDFLDGGSGDDVIAGDNALVERRGDTLSPRMQVLFGDVIYGEAVGVDDGVAQVTGDEQLTPVGVYGLDRVSRTIVIYDHRDDFENDDPLNPKQETHGDDYIAGGADDDEIFGQLGDDVIQGDGSVGGASDVVMQQETDHLYSTGDTHVAGQTVLVMDDDMIQLITLVGAHRDTADGSLDVSTSAEDTSDGDDYIEGNGGDDIIFGNLGQDDIVGGSSNLFVGLAGDERQRPDGSDFLFGGAGTQLARNNDRDLADGGHARDADVIAGDNANITRLVGTDETYGGAFLTFQYDNYDALKIIPRAVELLDYTEGGPDFDPTSAAMDNGAHDEVHGESGDDVVYAQVGGDIVFGEGQDDDLIGGWGHDWISGGTGEDGVLGDDGRIYTSRNDSNDEPLYGIDRFAPRDLDLEISTPGNIQQATINTSGELKKTVNLTPFNLTEVGQSEDPLHDPSYADDIIYGGLGGDFLHGGAGDDAMSGAEALPQFYNDPQNTGDVLRYGQQREGEFAAYDEFDPLRKILVGANEFLLNFDAGEGDPTGQVYSDGNDVLFGDLGNDWIVGGTGRDHLYGGYGDDLLNADDDHDSTADASDLRANNVPDGPQASYEDRAFGGAGRDVLIANTGGDRLIDWAGEFNSYLVPFAPFRAAAISRSLQPQLMQYLYDLSASDGADPTRADDTATDSDEAAARNGEPEGELGLVKQQDADWQAQTGAPADIQPGNIPGGRRDVLRGADFNNGRPDGFFIDSGAWEVSGGRMEVSPNDVADTLEISQHRTGTGDAVVYSAGDGTAIGGLVDGQTYYVIRIDSGVIMLAATAEDAAAGAAIDLTSMGSGTSHTLTTDKRTVTFDPSSAIQLGGDAASVFYVDHLLPSYFEVRATINAGKPTGGTKSNAYLIFDYQSSSDFKFAGVNIFTDKIEMGYRDELGWHVVEQTPARLRPNRDYQLLLALNGTAATLVVNGADVFTHVYDPRVDAFGNSYGLNAGMVGLGTDNSIARIDNVAVQVLPPEITLEDTDDFSDGVADLFTGPTGGAWQVSGTGEAARYEGQPQTGQTLAFSATSLEIGPAYLARVQTTFSADALGGVIFDQYGSSEYKFAAFSAATGEVVIGHHTARKGLVIDAAVDAGIVAGTDYELTVTLGGTTVSVLLDGQTVLGYSFNALVLDGDFGLFTHGGASSFDTVTVSTDDPAYLAAEAGTKLFAAAALQQPAGDQDTLTADQSPTTSVRVEGTAGDDLFVVTVGLTAGTWSVLLNGRQYPVSTDADAVQIDGLGGDDTLILTATDGDDSLVMRPGHIEMHGDGYAVTAANVETATVYGRQGNDTASLYDSAGDDQLVQWPAGSMLSGTGFSNKVQQFESVYAYVTEGGLDLGKVYDSPGDDHFVATTDYTRLTGDGFLKQAEGFLAIHAYATAGGNDKAELYDSVHDDLFAANSIGAALFNPDYFYYRAKHFEAVEAYATEGGIDQAKLFDSPGDDQFAANPQRGELSGESYYLGAVGFEGVHAYATAGGHDIARFNDSAGDDRFVGTPQHSALFGDGYYNRAKYFEEVYANSSAGHDTARLIDSAGDDHFRAADTWAKLSWTERSSWVNQFDQVQIESTNGGKDTQDVEAIDFVLRVKDHWGRE